MRNEKTNLALLRTISKARLTKYLETTDHDLSDALSLYEYNSRLSEAFYRPLQGVEVCLRNTLHESLAAKYGERWFESEAAPLTPDSESHIQEALDELRKSKDIDAPEPGCVIAELKFSFWVGLLGPKYDASLWRGCLHKCFKSKSGLPRKTVHGRFNAIRRFRNRVFHHEPIFHSSPKIKHDEIVEAIAWMCPVTADWVSVTSSVQAVTQTSPLNTPSGLTW